MPRALSKSSDRTQMVILLCPSGYERLVSYRLGSGTLSKASNLLADSGVSTRYAGPRVEVVGHLLRAIPQRPLLTSLSVLVLSSNSPQKTWNWCVTGSGL
jgi:hypothetical protein